MQTLYLLNKMPLNCCITNCRSNYKPEEEAVSVFSFPDGNKEGGFKGRWIKFANRKNWAHTELFRNFIKHFQPMYKQGNRNRLLKHLKPVPTLFDPKIEDESAVTSQMKAPVSTEEI